MNIQLTTADLQGKEGLLTEAFKKKLMNCINKEEAESLFLQDAIRQVRSF